jgi:hypothetical protein
VGILGTLFLFNFVWGWRIITAMRAGRDVIARWTVDPASFERFRQVDGQIGRTEGDNDYRASKQTSPHGVEVIFSTDGVLIGDTFFGLASTGLGRFKSIGLRALDPPVLEFGTVMTGVINTTHVRMVHTHGALRVPVAKDALAQASAVQRHFQDVLARRTVVKPNFWRLRVRIGIAVAVLSFLAAGVGVALREQNSELANVPLVLAVGGVVLGMGGLVLAILARTFQWKQSSA